LSSLARAWTTSSMWADSTKMSTNASRGAMVLHTLDSLPAAILRFIDSLPRLMFCRIDSQIPALIHFSDSGLDGEDSIIQINHTGVTSFRKERSFQRNPTTPY